MEYGILATLTTLVLMTSLDCLTTSPLSGRGRRSDDPDPLQTVVSGLIQRVDQLTAQLQAEVSQMQSNTAKLQNQSAQLQSQDSRLQYLEGKVRNYETKLADLESTVAFTAVFSTSDIQGLGTGQTLRFDKVIYNVGSAYSTLTGHFTAPSAGTYAFFLHLRQNLSHGDPTIQVGLYQGETYLIRVTACCSHGESSSNMAVVHLQKGDIVRVMQMDGGMLQGDHTTFTGFKISPL